MFQLIESLVRESEQRLFGGSGRHFHPRAFHQAAVIIKREARRQLAAGVPVTEVIRRIASEPVPEDREQEVAFYERHIRLVFRCALEGELQ